MVSCENQYQKFPQLIRSEVLRLLKWQQTQPHLPTITGEYNELVDSQVARSEIVALNKTINRLLSQSAFEININ